MYNRGYSLVAKGNNHDLPIARGNKSTTLVARGNKKLRFNAVTMTTRKLSPRTTMETILNMMLIQYSIEADQIAPITQTDKQKKRTTIVKMTMPNDYMSLEWEKYKYKYRYRYKWMNDRWSNRQTETMDTTDHNDHKYNTETDLWAKNSSGQQT